MKTVKLGDIVSIPGTANRTFADLFEDPEAAAKDTIGRVTVIFEGTKRVGSSTNGDAILILDNSLYKKVRLSHAY